MQDITKFMRLQQDCDREGGKLARLKSNKEKSDKDRNNRGSGKHVRGDERYSTQYHQHSGRKDKKSYCSSRSRGSDCRDRKHKRFSNRDRRSDKGTPKSETRGKEFLRPDKRDCPKHHPCKHTWEECSENPQRKKKSKSHFQEPDDKSNASKSKASHSSAESNASREEENYYLRRKI